MNILKTLGAGKDMSKYIMSRIFNFNQYTFFDKKPFGDYIKLGSFNQIPFTHSFISSRLKYKDGVTSQENVYALVSELEECLKNAHIYYDDKVPELKRKKRNEILESLGI